MKYVKQFLVIVAICFAGEGIKRVLPLPIPASIYGLLILLLLLQTGLLEISRVKEASSFLIDSMSIMFIPPAVGIMTTYQSIGKALVPILFITLISTVAVMGTAGRITQHFIERIEKNGNGTKKGDASR